jgi:hypothetical protein
MRLRVTALSLCLALAGGALAHARNDRDPEGAFQLPPPALHNPLPAVPCTCPPPRVQPGSGDGVALPPAGVSHIFSIEQQLARAVDCQTRLALPPLPDPSCRI